MNCKNVNKNLIGYIEQAIPSKLQEEMEKHFNECTVCKELYVNVLATYTVYDNRLIPEVNPFFYTRLEQKLKTKTLREVTFVPNIIWKLRPIAVIILIFIGINMGILIGKSFSGSGITLNNSNRTEILEAYASDYYLTDTGEESMKALITNE